MRLAYVAFDLRNVSQPAIERGAAASRSIKRYQRDAEFSADGGASLMALRGLVKGRLAIAPIHRLSRTDGLVAVGRLTPCDLKYSDRMRRAALSTFFSSES